MDTTPDIERLLAETTARIESEVQQLRLAQFLDAYADQVFNGKYREAEALLRAGSGRMFSYSRFIQTHTDILVATFALADDQLFRSLIEEFRNLRGQEFHLDTSILKKTPSELAIRDRLNRLSDLAEVFGSRLTQDVAEQTEKILNFGGIDKVLDFVQCLDAISSVSDSADSSLQTLFRKLRGPLIEPMCHVFRVLKSAERLHRVLEHLRDFEASLDQLQQYCLPQGHTTADPSRRQLDRASQFFLQLSQWTLDDELVEQLTSSPSTFQSALESFEILRSESDLRSLIKMTSRRSAARSL